MTDDVPNEPLELNEPEPGPDAPEPAQAIWMRGLYMVIFAIFFGIAEGLLCVVAVVQFLWILIKKERNQGIADFGLQLGSWLRKVAEFQSGASEDKPFPWAKWG